VDGARSRHRSAIGWFVGEESHEGAVHLQITTIGLDIAKNVFQVHGIDAAEKVIIRKQLRRGQVMAFFEALAQVREGIKELLGTVAQDDGSRLPVNAHASLTVLAAHLLDAPAVHELTYQGRSGCVTINQTAARVQ
jgi:hypothetical protein